MLWQNWLFELRGASPGRFPVGWLFETQGSLPGGEPPQRLVTWCPGKVMLWSQLINTHPAVLRIGRRRWISIALSRRESPTHRFHCALFFFTFRFLLSPTTTQFVFTISCGFHTEICVFPKPSTCGSSILSLLGIRVLHSWHHLDWIVNGLWERRLDQEQLYFSCCATNIFW